MNHPFLQSIRTIGFYFGTWVLISVIHFSVLFFFYDEMFIVAVADSAIFNMLYCIMAIPIWYAVRYSQFTGKITFNLVFSHVVSLIIILFIWFGTGRAILPSIFPDNIDYQHFFSKSMPWRVISGFLYYMIIVMVYYVIIYYNNLQEKLRNESKLNEMVIDSELNLLKAQINPHFLFNSLNSVSSLTITNPEKAQEMVVKLSDFLRYTVSRNNEKFSSLQLEFENTRRYLDIEKVRFGSKLEYDFILNEECTSIQIPVMILQPLYENAVKHGVYESTGKVLINTTCHVEECCIEISIKNNFEPGAPLRKGAGIGLKNIRERLKLIYHNEQLLQTKIEGNIFEAILIIPKEVASMK
ncbi:MAG: histidine kinase [Bacteroidetes bacterium]|nr:histidine kinase [Bacteroidota bacterium]